MIVTNVLAPICAVIFYSMWNKIPQLSFSNENWIKCFYGHIGHSTWIWSINVTASSLQIWWKYIVAQVREKQVLENGTRIPRSQKKYSNLERLEVGLGQARAAIREAQHGNQTEDHFYVPNGPMYWNPKAFHRYIFFSIFTVPRKSHWTLYSLKIVLK